MSAPKASSIDRRRLLRTGAGVMAGVLLPAHVLGADSRAHGGSDRRLFASACRDPRGRQVAIVFDPDSGELIHSVELPERGHGIALRPRGGPGDAAIARRDLVTFARRPGNFAVVLDLDQAREPLWLTTRSDRHFFGHGIYSADGRLLYTTENDFESGNGVIGVRDATDGYRQIGELASGGVEPHELAMLSDRRTIVVANGGILTHPDEPRYENTSTMQPSLAYVDSRTGDVLERHELPAGLQKLSIRHLAVGTGDVVLFGCQWRGPPWQIQCNIGSHRRGQTPGLLALADGLDGRIRNYVASVVAGPGGETAVVSAPNGGLAVLIEVATGRCLATHDMPDVFGAAPHHDGFLLTAGNGGMESVGGERWAHHGTLAPGLASAWDNHLLAVG
jgi:uncharacterized protein